MYIITNSSLCCFVIPVVSAITTVMKPTATKTGVNSYTTSTRRDHTYVLPTLPPPPPPTHTHPLLYFSHSPLFWIDATVVVVRFATILAWFGATYLPAAMMAKCKSPTDNGPRFRPSGRFRALKKAFFTIADPTHHASCNTIC